MKRVPTYNHFKIKGEKEVLIDLVELNYIKPYVSTSESHALTYYDILFIREGQGFFTINEQTHIVKEGDIVFTKQGEVRNWDNKNIKNGQALVFDKNFVTTLFNDKDFVENLSFFAAGRYSIKCSLPGDLNTKANLLLGKISTALSAPVKDRQLLRSSFDDLLNMINSIYINEHNVLPMMPEVDKKVNNRHVSSFLSMVNNEYSSQHSIRYYADKLEITPSYLNEMTKKAIGINAKKYIQNRLTLEAKRMLSHTDHSLSFIAEALSFDNVSYFVRFFRTQTSHTPMQYRNMMKYYL